MVNDFVRKYLNIGGFPRTVKRLIMVAADLLLIPFALWSAVVLRLGEFSPDVRSFAVLFLIAPVVTVPVFSALGLYRAIVRFMGSQAVAAVFKGAAVSAMAIASITLILGVQGVPRSVFFIYGGCLVLYVGGSRYLVRRYFDLLRTAPLSRVGVAIYGAGHSGRQLATALANEKVYKVAAFIDDNPALHGSSINGIRIYHPAELKSLIGEWRIQQVLLAMPSISRGARRSIVDRLEPLPVLVRTIPGVGELMSGEVSVEQLRDVDIEDLLGRDTVAADSGLPGAFISGKSVMVSGAGGSIGAELCRQIVRLGPARLVLMEISEFALYQVERELLQLIGGDGLDVEIVPLLGTVVDQRRMEEVMRVFEVSTVYHAAAYKHVPLVEHNVIEGVRNNIFGTLSAAQAAKAAGVELFVLISTDKAVRPTNVMGCTKRFAELILQGLSEESSGMRLCMVRFGNVLGSSGSVVPLFRNQIRRGGPVTVTHPEIVRYFMTIAEAVELVLQAGSMSQGGEVFLLDMGEPVKILDLARRMIHLMGFEVLDESNPGGDIAIQFTGLRPGEKLYEELLIGDNVAGTAHPRIMRGLEAMIPNKELNRRIETLRAICERGDCAELREFLIETVSGYTPRGDIQDLLWQRKGIDRAGMAAEERSLREED
ncbi:polysaccharide biosynthesis protein [Endothiovibrio diazotrophicus]